MEYKLNKIDPEVRRRVNEVTKSGKVHGKNSIKVNEDNKKNKKDFESQLKKQRDKEKKLLVDAVLEDHTFQDPNEENKLLGTILDIRK